MGVVYLPHVYQIEKSNQNFINSIKKYNKNCRIVGHNHESAAPRDSKELVAHDFKGQTIDKALDSIIGKNEHTRVVFNMVCSASSEMLPPLVKQSVLLPKDDHFAFCKISGFIDLALNQRIEPEPTEPVLNLSNVKISDLNLMMHALNKQYPVSGAVKLKNGLLFVLKDKIFHLSLVDNNLTITTLNFFGVDLEHGFVCPSGELAKQLDSEYFQPFKDGNYSGELFPADKNNFSLKDFLTESLRPPMLQILHRTVEEFESHYGTQDQLNKLLEVFANLNENEQEEHSKYIYMTNALLVAKMKGTVPETYYTKEWKCTGYDFDDYLEHYLHVAKGVSNSNTSLKCKIIGSCMMLLGLSLIIAGTTLSLLSLGIGVFPGAPLIAGGCAIGVGGLGFFAFGRSKAPSTIMANCGEQIAEAESKFIIS